MTDHSSRVSAVVVSHDSAEHLQALLPTLSRATGEVVVIDNASGDGSADVAERHGARVIRNNANAGYAAALNAGFREAASDFVLVINPDVRIDEAAVDALRAAAKRHPGHILGPVIHLPTGRIQPTRSALPSLLGLLGEELLVPERARPGSWPARLWTRWQRYDVETDAPLLSGACLLIPRTAWETVGPFDEGFFMYWEEKDWQLRARQRGVRAILVPSAQVVHARSTSAGANPKRKSRLFATSTRRFVRRWLPGWRGRAALRLLWVGQAVRLVAWSLPGLRSRHTAEQRRIQHRTALRGLGARDEAR